MAVTLMVTGGVFVCLGIMFLVMSSDHVGIALAFLFACVGTFLFITGHIVNNRDISGEHALTQLRHDGWKLQRNAIDKTISHVRVAPCVTMDLHKFKGHYYIVTKRNAPGGGYNVLSPSIQPTLIAVCNGQEIK